MANIGKEDNTQMAKIDPNGMEIWKFLLTSHLEGKDCGEALTQPKPRLLLDDLNALRNEDGTETEESRKLVEKKKKLLKTWIKKDRKAYDIIVKSCTDNETAMNVILEKDNRQ